jgi:hypothetical protein
LASRAAELASTSGLRRILLAAAVLALAAALLVVGRWERRQQVDGQIRGLERIAAAVGPLDQASLTGYRVEAAFDCLVYRRGRNPYALELCFDRAGRLVEAIDRRTARPHYYSLRAEPSASTVRVDRAEVDRLLRRMGAS